MLSVTRYKWGLYRNNKSDENKTPSIAGNAHHKAIFSIITALGILVGFSWVQSFDGGVLPIAYVGPYSTVGARHQHPGTPVQTASALH